VTTDDGPPGRGFESWERNVWALALVVFIAFVGFQFFSPFLPLYVIELGVTEPTRVALWSGALTAVTPAVSGLLGPLWGRFADRVGRKMMMIRSLAGFVIIVAAMGLVTSVTQLLILRVLQGVIAGFSVFAMALASVSCPKDKVPVAIGRVQGAQLLSVAVGPAAGGYVASHFGLRYAFFVTAGMCAIALVGLIALFREGRPRADAADLGTGRDGSSFSLRDVLALRGFPLVLGLLFIGQFIDRGLSLLVPLKVSVLPDVTRIAATSGEIISLAAICATGSALAAGRLAQRWPAERLLLGGLLLGGLPCALMALAPGWQSLMLLRCLTGLCLGGALTLAYSLGGTLVSSERRGAAFGWLALSVQVGTAASPLASGGLAALSLSGAFLLDGALAWLGAGVLLIGARRLRRGAGA
jgi:DHA1 family multidrug resistance protein-like MFS transporter